MICLLWGSQPGLAQEIDPDTLQDVESQSRFDELMLDALPGSSASLRADNNGALRAMRLLVEHPNYRLGYISTAASAERRWALIGDTAWMLAAGDIVVQRGLGTLSSVARGMGRSRLAPFTGQIRRSTALGLHSPFRAGAGGLRGYGASVLLDSFTRVHAAWGHAPERPELTVAMLAADLQHAGITVSATLLAGTAAYAGSLSGSASASGMIGTTGLAAELAFDASGRFALQCLASHVRRTASISLVLWNAHALADLPLGSLLASARSAANSWGGDLRLRISQRGVATVRLSLALSGTHGRSWLLPLASRTIDLTGDVEQRVTDRLHVEWRLRHRRDEDGVSDDLRRQNDRLLWLLRVRLRRIVHDRLEVRCNADLRLLLRPKSAMQSGTLGWVDARWKTGAVTILRFRASVFASDDPDVAPAMVEYSARGLQTLVSGNGFGRRMGMGVEWHLTPTVCLALQAAVESRLLSGEHRMAGDLRATITFHARRDDVLRSVTSPEDEMLPLRE